MTDDRQTDHAAEKCVAVGGIACARAIPRIMELSFPNSKIIIFNKLNTLRRRRNLIVYLLMRRPTLMM